MKIAVNTRLLLKDQMDGIGLFTSETFKQIVADHPEDEFYFIFDRQPHPSFIFASNIHPVILRPKARHPLLYKVWYQIALKRKLKKINPDLFVATDGMIPLKTNTKTLAVIHDLNFAHHPEHLPKTYSNYYQKYFPQFARQADRIATVSEYSKRDIVNTYNVADSKIDVVFNGANQAFQPIPREEQNEVKKRYTNGKDFFLFVGSIHPRKNLIRLFQAFEQFKLNTSSKMKLVVAGKKMWWSKDQELAFKKLSATSDIIFTGRIPLNELTELTSSAYALTYVPLFEGFGIPIIEAMSCGTPVITSNTTSMPEVAGGAGLLVNPTSVNDICEAMEKITSAPSLRDQLTKKSLERSTHFSWKKTADLLWDAMQKTINA